MTDANLTAENVWKTYGDTDALRGVSLSFTSPGVHLLAGPNGSGKSTLLSLFAELEEPTEGTIDRPSSSVLGFSFQRPSFHPVLTVDENLQTFSRLGNRSAEAQSKIRNTLRLDRVGDRQADNLSGGYQKLLDLGLAFNKTPDILILDEPLAGLDDDSRNRVLSLVADYAEDTIIILVAHRMSQFESMADDITVIADGEVEARTSSDDWDDLESWYVEAAGLN